MRRIAPTLLPLALTALLLAGCSSASPGGSPAEADPAASAATNPTATDPAAHEDASADQSSEQGTEPGALPECDGILFETGAEIAGQQLGDCMAAAMYAAGSGSHRVDEDTGRSSLVHFQWTPEFSMSVEGDAPIVVRGDTGWANLGPRGWVQADPSSTDGEVLMATTIIEASKAFGDPRVIGSVLGQSDWRVVGETSVPATDAVADIAWQLEPVSALPFGPVTMTDYQLWLRNDYLGAYSVGTGSFGGITATTSNTYLQWGEAVEIPDPMQP